MRNNIATATTTATAALAIMLTFGKLEILEEWRIINGLMGCCAIMLSLIYWQGEKR